MPGMFMDMGLGVTAAPQKYGSSIAPSTASEAAYGTGAAVAPRSGLHPGTSTGLAFWVGTAAIVGLVALYMSLPG